MKFKLIVFALLIQTVYAQDNFTASVEEELKTTTSIKSVGANGFNFSTLDAGVNTKYSEFGSGFFMDKFIMVSSKKLGGLGKIDPQTGEGFKNLFCLDIKKDGSLKKPLLFSRIINTLGSEDQISFSPDEQSMYFTRATKENTSIYKLYRTVLEKDSNGNWIDQTLTSVNVEGFSVENPFVNKEGTKLYFSSNKPGGFGGYDLYVATIEDDGSLSNPINLGAEINTIYDDKYPSLSLDGTQFYFSSKGHNSIGGFDVYRAFIDQDTFKYVVNLGNTVNTSYDEVAFFMASKTKGYLTSNKATGKGSYDLYKFDMSLVTQRLEGVIVDSKSNIPLPNTKITLYSNGKPIATAISNKKAQYSFDVLPFETYEVKASKEGFNDKEIKFVANNGDETVYKENLSLDEKDMIIENLEDKRMIVVNNIYFDYNKATIKKESEIPLNSIVRILNENPEMNLVINAHTDERGKEQYNLDLSIQRAAAAKAYLIANGIAKDRLESNGFGETQLINDCKRNCSEEEHQQNRRIEFVIK